MRRLMVVVATAALVLGGSGAAFAAEIDNLSGQSCGDLTGEWHFVNNQTGGAAAGFIEAEWDSGDVCVTGASKVSKNNQHFDCIASGELISAVTNLPGKLVLSDFSCETKCDKDCPEPPK